MGLAKQISWYTLGNVVTLFAQWLIIMLIPKITDFTEAGLFAIGVSVASIMNQVATFTLNQYQVADGHRRYNRNDFALARLVTIAVSFVLILPVSVIFGYGLLEIAVITAYTLYRNLINYAYLHISELQLIGHLDYVGILMILEGMISFTAFMAAYILAEDLLLAMVIMAVIGGGFFLMSIAAGYAKYSGERYGLDIKSRDKVAELLKIGLPLLASTLAPIIITALPKLILENQWGKEAVGYFSTLTAPTILIPTLALAVFTPLIGHFSKICASGDRRKLNIQYTKILLALAAMAGLCYVISILFAEPVFKLLYGEEIVPYVYCFHVLLVGIFLYSAGICGITVLITKNQGRFAGISSIVALILSAVIFALWIPSGGMDAATWGLFISYGIFGLLISLCVYVVPLTRVTDNNNISG